MLLEDAFYLSPAGADAARQRSFGLPGAERSSDHRVDAPRTWTRKEQVEEHEAKQHREIAAVQYGEPGLRKVSHEVGHCHVAGQDEGDRSAQEPDQKQHAAGEFQDALESFQRDELQVVELRLMRHAEKLRR